MKPVTVLRNKLSIYSNDVMRVAAWANKHCSENQNNLATITGLPVKIRKVLFCIDSNDVVALTGIVNANGVELRCVWNAVGCNVETEGLKDVQGTYTSIEKEYPSLFRIVELN